MSNDFDQTDPLYQQLMGDDESIQPNRSGKDKRKRHEKKPHRKPPYGGVDSGPEGPASDYAPELSQSSHEETSMSLLNLLIPPVHDSAENIRRHRIVVSLSVVVLFLALGASYGVFERFGVSGFARADSIQKATQPLEQQISKQTTLLDKVSAKLTAQLAASTASEIRVAAAKRCLERSSDVRNRISGEIDTLQDQYREYKGFNYPVPGCAEL